MRFVSLAILSCLAGCAEPADNRQAEALAREEAAARAGFRPGGPAPMATVAIDPVPVDRPGTRLPPATMEYRYIGRWAATPALCRDGAWTFETHRLSTAGETSCRFAEIAAMLEGFRLEGQCTAEGRNSAETLELSFDEARKRMHVEGKTLGPADLIYCGA